MFFNPHSHPCFSTEIHSRNQIFCSFSPKSIIRSALVLIYDFNHFQPKKKIETKEINFRSPLFLASPPRLRSLLSCSRNCNNSISNKSSSNSYVMPDQLAISKAEMGRGRENRMSQSEPKSFGRLSQPFSFSMPSLMHFNFVDCKSDDEDNAIIYYIMEYEMDLMFYGRFIYVS